MSELFTPAEAQQVKALRGRVEKLERLIKAISVPELLDQDDMISDSSIKGATQQSIKAYVDDNAGGGGIDNVVEDTTPQLGGDLDGQSSYDIVDVGRIVVKQTEDSVGIYLYGYDDVVSDYCHICLDEFGQTFISTSDDLVLKSADDIKVRLGDNAGTFSFQVTDSDAAILFRVDSNGKVHLYNDIDGNDHAIADIGSLSFRDGGATVDIIRDEDAMSSNDANALATQQSIKAYVDAFMTSGGPLYYEDGSYTGNDSTGQTISLTDTNLDIKLLIISLYNGNDASNAVMFAWESLSSPALRMIQYVSGSSVSMRDDRCGLGTGQFIVDDGGSNQHPNQLNDTYYFIAIGTH